jgi:hypothetical protein
MRRFASPYEHTLMQIKIANLCTLDGVPVSGCCDNKTADARAALRKLGEQPIKLASI